MRIRVIDVVGTEGEVMPVLRQILELEPEASEPVEPTRAWTDEELADLWSGLTPRAQHILRMIADRPDGVSFQAIEKALNITASDRGGILSSVGHQMRRFPGRPHPVIHDYDTGIYRLLDEFADFIRQSENS